MGQNAKGRYRRCRACIEGSAVVKRLDYLAARREGLTNAEVGARFGVTADQVAQVLCRAKQVHGLDVPHAPYPKRRAS